MQDQTHGEGPQAPIDPSDAGASENGLSEVRTEIVLEFAKEARKSGHDLARWTIASLLIANGGALIGLLRLEETRPTLFDGAGWAFVGGFLAALLGGFFNSLHAEQYATGMENQLWTGSAARESSYKVVTDKATKDSIGSGCTSFLLLLTAFSAFGAGCWMVSKSGGTPASVDNRQGTDRQIEKITGANNTGDTDQPAQSPGARSIDAAGAKAKLNALIGA